MIIYINIYILIYSKISPSLANTIDFYWNIKYLYNRKIYIYIILCIFVAAAFRYVEIRRTVGDSQIRYI